MGYKGKSLKGELPETGAIFMSNIGTHKECSERQLFGLPSNMSNFVLNVKKGMTLFLFEFERRLLYGVFRATCDGEINIEPKAFRSSGKHFPAQVRFTTICDCSPLAEHEFKDVIRGNYYSGKKFNFGLNDKQVRKLMKLFRSKEISRTRPERNILRFESYDDKPSEGNARSGDLRKRIRHRKRFDSCDSRGDEVKEVDGNMYINKHIIEPRHKDKREGFLTNYKAESDAFADCGRHDILGKSLDLREKDIDDGYMPVFSKPDFREKDIEDRYMLVFSKPDFVEKDIEDRYMPVFSKPDFGEKDNEDRYMPVFSKPHGTHIDEIGVGSSGILMDCENKDIIDYNRLQDEYNVREGVRRSLNEHTLTNRVFSYINQNAYSNSDPTRIDVPDIQRSPSFFNDGSSFIPIADNCPFYSSPEKIPMSKSLLYYSHDDGSNRYLDDPGSQSSIFPKFISRNLSSDTGLRVHEVDSIDNDYRFCEKHESKYTFGTTDKRNLSSDAGLRVHEVDPTDNDYVFCETHESKYTFGTTDKRNLSSDAGLRLHEVDPTDNDHVFCDKHKSKYTFGAADKRVSVFSRLTDLRRQEKAFEADENPEISSSVDKVMKMLEKVVSSPKKRSGKSISVIKQDDGDNSPNSKLEDYEFPDVNLEVDTDMAYEDVEGESALKETRLLDFKRRKKLNKRTGDASKENSECLVGASDVGPVAYDQLMGMSHKRRKLVRPAFVEKNIIPQSVVAHENTPSANDSADVALESSEKVDAFIKVPTCHEKTPDDSSSKKAGSESLKKVDLSIKHTAHVSTNDSVNVALESLKKVDAFIKSIEPTCHENTTDDCSSTKAVSESSKKVDVLIKHTAHEDTLSANGSADVALASSEKFDAFIQSMVPSWHENTPDDSSSTKAGSENSKKVDSSIKHAAHEFMLSANDGADVALESSQKVDAFIRSMVATCHENTPDDGSSIKAESESSKKVDVSLKSIDLNMMPTSDESSSSKDDNNQTKVVLESQKDGNEGDGNAESDLVSDVFVEGVASKDDQKMCGWIDW